MRDSKESQENKRQIHRGEEGLNNDNDTKCIASSKAYQNVL
jgi:hypothetical protein